MLRRLTQALLVLTAICVTSLGLSDNAFSRQRLLPVSFHCRQININGSAFIFYFSEMGCNRARQLATFTHNNGRAPREFHCHYGTRGAPGTYCERNGNSRKDFGWYTEDARIGQAEGGVVLGGIGFADPNGEGWGTERPSRIFNGGDLSGLITHVRWNSWGGPNALGWGKESIFKPRGGYYRRPVSIKLRAEALGECEGRRAYTRLSFRYPKHPGGQLGPWRSWSGDATICSSPY